MNIALITKWWWSLLTCRNGLLQRILKDKYGPQRGSWSTKPRNNTNVLTFWKAIRSTADVFHSSIRYEIGWGSEDTFWRDRWCMENMLGLYETAVDKDALIGDYWHRGRWMINLDRDFLGDRVHDLTSLKFVLAATTIEDHDWDISEWRWSPISQHSVSSTYNTTIDGGQDLPIAN